MSKFIANTNTKSVDKIFLECECDDHILKLYKMQTSDEIILSVLGCDDDFQLYPLAKINEFYNLCNQILNDVKKQGYLLSNNYKLKILHEVDDFYDYYDIILTNFDEDYIYWDITVKCEAFEEFTQYVKEILNKMMLSKIVVKPRAKVRVKSLCEMNPTFIDEIGRYHFDLYDGTDIVFNEEMKEFCGNDYIINTVNPYIDKNGEVRCTFYLNPISQYENPNIIWYTFTLDMVEVI